MLEVLSPSTRSKDQIVKLKKYMEAGCREYWIVDIESRRIMVYDFRTNDWPKLYSFVDDVPVGISDGKCRVGLGGIIEMLESIPEEANG